MNQNIPGGATTQIAQEAGNPEYVGLSPDQVGQAQSAYEASIARGNDTYRHQQNAPQSASQEVSEPSQEGLEIVDITLPTGEDITVEVPVGMSDEDIRSYLIDIGEKGFKPDGSVVDRFMYGARQGDNITENIGNYAKSHFPILADEFYWGEDGLEYRTAGDRYGEDFYDLSPQQRRERIAKVDAELLAQNYPEIHPNNLGIAGGAGTFATALADPVALVPGGAALKGVKTGMEVAKQSAKVGAAWGATYGISDVASDSGLPTSLSELREAAPRVIEPTVIGTVAGPALGVPLYKGVRALTVNAASKAMRTPEATNKFAKSRYWPEIWEQQAQGKTIGEASSALRKKYKLSIDDEWRMRQAMVDEDAGWASRDVNRQGTALYSPASGSDDAVRRMGEAATSHWGDPILHGSRQQYIDDILRPIAGVVKDISPRIYKRLVDMEGNILSKAHEYHEFFRPFMSGVNGLRKVASEASYKKFSMALYNSRTSEARDIWLRHGLSAQSFDDMRFGLDRLRKELEHAGIEDKWVADYFPRMVQDHAGLRKASGKNPKLVGLEKFLSAAARRKGRKLTDSEINMHINRFMEKRPKGVKKTIGGAKRRSVQEVSDDILQYYYDPAMSLEYRLRETISRIERNKFYGKNAQGKTNAAKGAEYGTEDISKSVGALMRSEGITGADAARLSEVLNARFGLGEHSGRKTFSALRQITGGVTLGNPISAIRQLGDIPSVMKTQGVVNTFRAMFERQNKDINPDVFGYMLEMAQELDTKGASQWVKKASQAMYKYGGFRSVDRYSKGVLMRAALRNAQKSVKTPKSKMNFIKKYSGIYSQPEMKQIIHDLNNGIMSDLVKSHMNAEVMRIQPISRSQMPRMYLDHPNGRMVYQFRTWGLNQIELFRQDVWRGMRSNNPAERKMAAAKGLVFLTGVGTTNAVITEAQKLLTRRETSTLEETPDDVFWQMLGNFGLFDRYGIEKSIERGEGEYYLNTFMPPSVTIPSNFALKLSKLIMEQEVPDEATRQILKQTGIGRIVDFYLLGGAEEYNDKVKKDREAAFKATHTL